MRWPGRPHSRGSYRGGTESSRRDDPVSLASAIHLLVSDQRLRERLAGAAWRAARTYAWEQVTDQILRVYDEALRRYHRTPFNQGYPEQLAAVRAMMDGRASVPKEKEIVHDPVPGLG